MTHQLAPEQQQAVREAATAALDHGGPDCLTDPHHVLDAVQRAVDLGATHDDIQAEMQRQRATASR